MTIALLEGPTMTLTACPDLKPTVLRRAFGMFPTGVVGVAAEVDGGLVGLAASSFTSVSLDAPLVSISCANSSNTWSSLRRSSHLGVTVLADHHSLVCRQLAGPAEHRYEGVAYSVTRDGAVTLDDGLAHFVCTIYREVEAGDHVVVLLQLHEVRHTSDGDPLVFHRSAFGTLQLVSRVLAGRGSRPSPPTHRGQWSDPGG